MPNLLFMFISATYGSVTNRSRADGDEFDSLTHADGGIDSIAIIHNINPRAILLYYAYIILPSF